MKITMYYFTDPICSFCWAIEPILKRFELLYGQYFEMKYVMGGLLADWKSYEDDGGYIEKPSDVAEHWLEVCEMYNTPVNIRSWINDPVTSSYTPSIHYKAASMQGVEKGYLFLRKIKELLFLKGINISKEDVLYDVARSIGLDMEIYTKDIEDGFAEKKFKHDLIISKNFNVQLFPTLIFTNNSKMVTLEAYNDLEIFKNALEIFLGDVSPEKVNLDISDILKMYKVFTAREVSVILDISIEDAYIVINNLVEQSVLEKNKIDYLEYYSVIEI